MAAAMLSVTDFYALEFYQKVPFARMANKLR